MSLSTTDRQCVVCQNSIRLKKPEFMSLDDLLSSIKEIEKKTLQELKFYYRFKDFRTGSSLREARVPVHSRCCNKYTKLRNRREIIRFVDINAFCFICHDRKEFTCMGFRRCLLTMDADDLKIVYNIIYEKKEWNRKEYEVALKYEKLSMNAEEPLKTHADCIMKVVKGLDSSALLRELEKQRQENEKSKVKVRKPRSSRTVRKSTQINELIYRNAYERRSFIQGATRRSKTMRKSFRASLVLRESAKPDN